MLGLASSEGLGITGEGCEAFVLGWIGLVGCDNALEFISGTLHEVFEEFSKVVRKSGEALFRVGPEVRVLAMVPVARVLEIVLVTYGLSLELIRDISKTVPKAELKASVSFDQFPLRKEPTRAFAFLALYESEATGPQYRE